MLTRNKVNNLDLGPKYELDKNQKLGISIFEKALSIPEAEILMAPLSYTYYIEAGEVFIILDTMTLRIVNGKYQYHISIDQKTFERLSSRFKRVLERRRKQMEEKIINKTNRSLQVILEEVSLLSQSETPEGQDRAV